MRGVCGQFGQGTLGATSAILSPFHEGGLRHRPIFVLRVKELRLSAKRLDVRCHILWLCVRRLKKRRKKKKEKRKKKSGRGWGGGGGGRRSCKE